VLLVITIKEVILMAKDVNLEAEEGTDVEETDGDRREFLKTAVMAAGAIAAAAALGDLAGDDADAQMRRQAAEASPAVKMASTAVRGTQLKMVKSDRKKSFSLSGGELGKILQQEGFVGQGVKDPSNTAVTLSVGVGF
jgi:hypothetical protein